MPDPPPPEPVFTTEFGRFGVTLDGSPSRNIVITKLPAGELLAPIHKIGGGAGATIGVGVHALSPPWACTMGLRFDGTPGSMTPRSTGEGARHLFRGSPSRNIVITKLPAGELLAPIHVDRQVDLSAELKLGGGAGATIGVGVHAFIPSPSSGGAPVTNGVFIEATVEVGPP